MPAEASATTPAPSPDITTGAVALTVRSIGSGSFTGKIDTGGGSGSEFGVPYSRSSWSGSEATGVLGTAGPNVFGVPSPSACSNSAWVGRGRGVRYRSYCRSARCTMDPMPIIRAIGAIVSGSMRPSCSGRSQSLSRLVDAGEPYGMSSRAA